MLDTLNYYWDRFVDFYSHIRQYVLLPLEFKEISASYWILCILVFYGGSFCILATIESRQFNPAPIVFYYATLIFFLVQVIYWKLLFIYEDMDQHDFRKGRNIPELLRAFLHGVACFTFPSMLTSMLFLFAPHT